MSTVVADTDVLSFIFKLIPSVAIPPLGAGLGGLDWNDVRREIEQAFSGFEGVDVIVYEPTDTYHMGAEGSVSTDRRSR